ncbi:hypothetical protein Tco_0195292, partial [Tanacetum coccineum]
PTKSLGKVVRESIPGELSSSTYPRRHVTRDWYPQRQVAREGVELSLGIVSSDTTMGIMNEDDEKLPTPPHPPLKPPPTTTTPATNSITPATNTTTPAIETHDKI